MKTTKVFASGATCVNDEAAPAGPITAIGRIWVFLGAIAVLAGLTNLAAVSSIEILMADPDFDERIVSHPMVPQVGWMLRNARLLAVFQLGRASGAPAAAAMLGPIALFVALAVSALPLILVLRSLHGSRVRASFEAAPRS